MVLPINIYGISNTKEAIMKKLITLILTAVLLLTVILPVTAGGQGSLQSRKKSPLISLR